MELKVRNYKKALVVQWTNPQRLSAILPMTGNIGQVALAGAVGREIAPARHTTPRSSTDRTQACGACDAGSIPAEGTI